MEKKNFKSSEGEIKIGKTTYVVNCYCSLSKDEIKAKIARLIKIDAQNKN